MDKKKRIVIPWEIRKEIKIEKYLAIEIIGRDKKGIIIRLKPFGRELAKFKRVSKNSWIKG